MTIPWSFVSLRSRLETPSAEAHFASAYVKRLEVDTAYIASQYQLPNL